MGWTQAQLAERAGVHQPKISEIERGKETAHVGLVLRIVAALGLEITIGTVSDKSAMASAPVAESLIDEPRPDATIDLDAIVGPNKRRSK